MTSNEKIFIAQRKLEQYEHKTLLQENRAKDAKAKIDLRRKILVGEMFLRHFPIALEFTPGKSSEENRQIFEPLDDFMEALSKCQRAFQLVEDVLL